MRPAIAAGDAANGPRVHCHLLCHISLPSAGSQALLDFPNRRFGQLCHSVPFASIGSAVHESVRLIVSSGVPPQVFRRVVGVTTVVVAGDQARWSGAVKRLAHGNVRVDRLGLAAGPLEANLEVAKVSPARPLLSNQLRAVSPRRSGRASNPSQARHLVEPLPPREGSPLFDRAHAADRKSTGHAPPAHVTCSSPTSSRSASLMAPIMSSKSAFVTACSGTYS
jgi:hypothetical protein